MGMFCSVDGGRGWGDAGFYTIGVYLRRYCLYIVDQIPVAIFESIIKMFYSDS